MKAVFDQVLVLILFFALGWFLTGRGKIRDEQAGALSASVVYVFLPCTMLRTFAANCTAAYLRERYAMLLVGAGVILLLIPGAMFVSRKMSRDRYTQGIFEYILVSPSYAYIGYELCRALFGEAHLMDMMVFTIPASILYTYSIGYCRIMDKPISLKYLMNPIIWAICAGACIGVSGVKLPGAAVILLDKAAGCTGPVGMLAAGTAMARYRVREVLQDKLSGILVAFRLVIIPALAALVLRAVGLRDYVLPAVMMLSTPVGTNAVIFPRMIGGECRSAASALLLSHVFCLLTIPVMVTVFC